MNPPDSIPPLVQRAQSGDRHAFEDLVYLSRDRIENLIASRLGAHGLRNVDVENVLQETLLRSYRGIKKFEWRGQESFLHWLGAIVENVILEIARRGARHPECQLDQNVSEHSKEILNSVRVLVSSAQPDQIKDPKLEVVKRKIKSGVEEIVGEGLIEEVLLPVWQVFIAD